MTAVLHASCVAVGAAGLLILGPSGAGKSALALQMLALGAELVSDDRTEVFAEASHPEAPNRPNPSPAELATEPSLLVARPPTPLQGLIEARFIGLLRTPFRPQVHLALAVDLGQAETDRLPPSRHIRVEGCDLPLVLGPLRDHLASALVCLLKGSRFA